MARKVEDLTGKRFGEWKVISLSDRRNRHSSLWWCECACGIKREIPRGNLTTGLSKSCQKCGNRRSFAARLAAGILAGWRGTITHGHTTCGKFSPEYRSYANAKQMFTNPKNPSFPNFGGRGVKFLFESFEQFFAEIGERPEPKNMYTIALINSDGNFGPGNVAWVTKTEKRLYRRQMGSEIEHAA